jgi:hypothetical protein
MAAPNLIGASTINGKTTTANLTSTAATSILSNASGSGHCFKINTLQVSNYKNASANITVSIYSAAALSGTANSIAGNISVPAFSTLTLIDKSTQYYLEEDKSIGAVAGTGSSLSITLSYEDIF